MKKNNKNLVLTGGQAVGLAITQARPAVMAVYPITPQTPVVEYFSKKVANGEVDTELIQVESEHSAISACVGSSAAGVRTATASSSQGIMYMMEVLPIASALRLPIVMAVANRAISAPINIHVDHSDAMMMRDCGWLQLFAENVQEAYDLTLMAFKIAEKISLPVAVNFDGFVVSHSMENLNVLENAFAEKFLGDYQPKESLLNFSQPKTFGSFAMPDYYYQFRFKLKKVFDESLIQEKLVFDNFSKLTNRYYQAIENYKISEAETVIVALGSICGTIKEVVDKLRTENKKVGLLKIISFRPLPVAEIRKALAKVDRVIVLDRNLSFGATQVLAGEVETTLNKKVESFVFGLGGAEISEKDIEKIFLGKEIQNDSILKLNLE